MDFRSNYTTSYSSIDDRFSFSRKGIFWCRRKNETADIAVYIFVCVIVTAIIWSIDFVLQAHLASILWGFVIDALKIGSLIALPLLLVAGIRSLRSGEQYRYTADESKMLIVCPKRNIRADIYYEKVQNVLYEDVFASTGKLRGYKVSIICADKNFSFFYLFPYKMHQRNKDFTPFRIIEERCGLLNKPEFLAGKRIDNAGLF